MTRDEATTILAGLTAAFPTARLEDDTPEVWRKHLMPLDFEVADRAVGQCVDNLKFFPSVAEFREFYRLERHNTRKEPSPEVLSRDEIQEWVHVWKWQLDRTRTLRQAENEARFPHTKVDERPPRKMRDFPQQHEPGSDVLSLEEYGKVREGWVRAGQPMVGGLNEVLVAAMGG